MAKLISFHLQLTIDQAQLLVGMFIMSHAALDGRSGDMLAEMRLVEELIEIMGQEQADCLLDVIKKINNQIMEEMVSEQG